ncbi:HAD family hydrolase [Azospirillum doebereinerae]|uniref:HAD family phosphatase n=1 Tax=Azospirillum doebereinerae TaxID=92933 RepID=A0A433JE87_9PROT|nr:HAD family phosphatase [Azospirillum doebereinerae]RUQ75203.1 HAD family phosphatase [Azospirillum doebereinerae]
MAIEAILFDMDGVLVDARDWHYEALNKALRLFGMEIGVDDHLASFDGLPTRRKLEILSRSRGLPEALHGFLNELKQRHTEEIIAVRCRPVFHIQYAVSRLRRDGYRLAVCSNSVRNSVLRMMELSGLMPHLDFCLSNEDIARSKPHPEIYETAIGRLGLSPGRCLIVEDNEHGITAARAAGGHLMEVGGIEDVTYARIRAAIANADRKGGQ